MKRGFRPLPITVLMTAGAASAVTLAAPDESRCAAIAVSGARLACYDRCATVTEADARLACYDASAHPRTAGPIAPPSAISEATTRGSPAPSSASAPAPAFDPTDPKNFGLSQRRQWTEAGPKSVSARIVQISNYQGGTASIVLDSGQTWVVSDDDGRLSTDERITIKRAALGSFLLWDRSNHSYHVRRIQ